MKSLFVGFIVLFGSMAFAQEDLNFSEYRKFLMNGTKTQGQKFAIETTCTTTTGQTYRIGETGYDTCLSAVKEHQKMKQLSGDKGTTAPGAESSTTTTIHFGN